MTDILADIQAAMTQRGRMAIGEAWDLLDRAADEVERLRAKIEEWKTVYEAADKNRDETYDKLGEAAAENERLRDENDGLAALIEMKNR